MFDNISIVRTGQTGPAIDLGTLAEAMLFYDKVHLLLNRGSLTSLLTELGAEAFDRLVERPELRVSFWSQNFGTVTNTSNGIGVHNYAIFEIGSPDRRRRLANKEQTLEEIIKRSSGQRAATRRRVKQLMAKFSFPRVEDDIPAAEVTEAARRELADDSFVQKAVGLALETLVPNFPLPAGWHFRAFMLNDGSFAADTNLDFKKINLEYHKTVPPEQNTITPAYLLTLIFDAHVGTVLASRYMSELVHDPLCASLMKIKYLNLLRRRDQSMQEIDLFQNLHLEGRRIGEVVNSRERTLDEFFKLLDRAQKFKHWLRNKNPDEKLLREYFAEATKETWIDKLPSKGARWIITTGLGLAVDSLYPTGAATLAAQGVSALDAMLLDRILRGWRPDQFVNGPLASFVRPR